MKNKMLILLLLLANQKGYNQNKLNDIKEYLNSTVTIFLEGNTKSGSGFIIENGKIVTNSHVIEGNNNGYVIINGTDEKHKIEGYYDVDFQSDIAILYVPTLKGKPLQLADELPKKGEKVFAFENAQISTKVILEGNVDYSSSSNISGIIKTTIPFKFGNSGGALVNTKGKVLGVVFSTTLTVDEGLIGGYAIDASFLKKLLINKVETIKKLNIPNGGYYYLNQSRLKYETKDFSAALIELNKSIELNPKLFMSYINRASLNLKLNNLKSCIEDCNKTLEIIPNLALGLYIRGLANLKLKNNKTAIEDFDKSIEFDTNFALAYNMRGVAKANIKDINGANNDFNTSIEIEPKNSLFYISRGGFKFFLTNKIEGCQDFWKAKELGHKDAQAFLNKFCH